MTEYVPGSWDACGDGDDEVVTFAEMSEGSYEEGWDAIDDIIDRETRGKHYDAAADRVRHLIELANRWAACR